MIIIGFGLALIALGIILFFLATTQYKKEMNEETAKELIRVFKESTTCMQIILLEEDEIQSCIEVNTDKLDHEKWLIKADKTIKEIIK